MNDYLKELEKEFEMFYRMINHKQVEQFSLLMIEAIKSGDFQICLGIDKNHLWDDGKKKVINLEKTFGLTYIPFREVSELKQEITQLKEALRDMSEALVFYYENTKDDLHCSIIHGEATDKIARETLAKHSELLNIIKE